MINSINLVRGSTLRIILQINFMMKRLFYAILFVFFTSETSFIAEDDLDPSDRTLIRVLRSEFDDEEKGQTTLKARKTRKGKLTIPII